MIPASAGLVGVNGREQSLAWCFPGRGEDGAVGLGASAGHGTQGCHTHPGCSHRLPAAPSHPGCSLQGQEEPSDPARLHLLLLSPGRLPGAAGGACPAQPRVLTGADGGQLPQVPEQPAERGAGAGVEPVPADAQLELQPAGLGTQRQRRRRGGQVQLLPVQLVPPAREVFWG